MRHNPKNNNNKTVVHHFGVEKAISKYLVIHYTRVDFLQGK